MTITLTHPFVSPKADGPDATLVQPSNWNAEHTLEQATSRILGRTSPSNGPTEELSVSSPLALAAGALTLDAAATRTYLDLEIGIDVQAWDAELDAWAARTAPAGTVV
ncbi:MAG TPA: hypothetical protein V6D20_13400, partial [Candidatus Obscuribacterales bacterium]